MKEITKSIVTINDTEELILKKPKNRKETVRVTQGGMREHATEISIEDFEKYTGMYFKGMEPESKKNI